MISRKPQPFVGSVFRGVEQITVENKPNNALGIKDEKDRLCSVNTL